MTETQKMLNVEEFAQQVGLSPGRIRQLIRAKKIDAININGWKMEQAEVERFKDSRRNNHDRAKNRNIIFSY